MGWIYLGGTKDGFVKETPASRKMGKSPHQQQTATSCWANCAKHVINYYRSRRADLTRLTEDEDIETGIDLSKVGGITEILEKYKHKNEIDEYRIPEIKDIDDAIKAGQPLVINVGAEAATTDLCNDAAEDGHWMVIVGSNFADNKILIFDPDDGEMHEYTWHSQIPSSAKYKDWFWQNTSYVDK